MKKWWILPIVAAVGVTGFALLLPSAEEAVSVRGQRLELQRIEETVSCQGVLEAGKKQAVFPEIGCVIEEILVEKGQAVDAGQVLMKVNKAATRGMQGSQRETDALSLATMPESIVAPVDGIVLSVEATVGSWMSKEEPCVVLASRDALQVRMAIKEKQLPKLREGQSVRVSSDGLGEQALIGRLEEISATAVNTAAGEPVVEGVVSLEEGQSNKQMRLGLTVKARVVTAVTEEGVLLPYEALMHDNDRAYVYISENGMVARRDVQVKAELAKGALLADTALAAETVLLEPNKVQPGDAVAVKEEGAS